MAEFMIVTRANDTRKPGAYVDDGVLFFRLPNNGTIVCTCIAEPFASQIVDLFNRQAGVKIPQADWRSFCGTGEELC